MANVLFFVPHQDDEVLTLGVGIRSHVEAGHNVHVILCTDGSGSIVRDRLNGLTPCGLHGMITHNPSAEGYPFVEDVDFIKARDDEFKAACLALGVPSSNIHISRLAVQDGTLAVWRAKQIMRYYLNLYPNASVKTHTYNGEGLGQLADHYNLGKALKELVDEGYYAVSDARWYVEHYHKDDIQAAHPELLINVETCSSYQAIKDACAAYNVWNPSQSKFAIGYHSVYKYFNTLLGNPVGYYHK